MYISVKNNTNFKKFLFLSIYTIWDRLSLKTISRYCPFKPLVCASRSSERYAVVSKGRDRCLSGSSALESPEKVRGIEESNDNFRIEFEDYELQQEEMEEMEEMEEEKENEKEKEMEEEQKKEEGELALTVLKPPFSHQQGFTCTSCMSKNYATAYPCCVCCGFKVS